MINSEFFHVDIELFPFSVELNFFDFSDFSTFSDDSLILDPKTTFECFPLLLTAHALSETDPWSQSLIILILTTHFK